MPIRIEMVEQGGEESAVLAGSSDVTWKRLSSWPSLMLLTQPNRMVAARAA